MAKYKDGVMIRGERMVNGELRLLSGPSQEVEWAIAAWDAINQEEGYLEGTVTALGDGQHSVKNSKHYGTYRVNAGEVGWWIDAVDFRTRYMDADQKERTAAELRLRLGSGYDIVLHSTHIHAEFDPK